VIAVDSSTLVAFLQGKDAADTRLLNENIKKASICLPPVAVTEILSANPGDAAVLNLLADIKPLEILPHYWERAAATRHRLLSKRLKARLPDALIAQSCIDHDVALITRDADFQKYAEHCGLRLAG
jgi:predicted nucleic acid-binding protein